MEEVFGRRTKQPRCYVAAKPRGLSECGWGVLVCRPAGILTSSNGPGEADRESWRCGKAAVQGGVRTSRIQLGKATSGESRVLREVVQPRRTYRQRQQRDFCRCDWVCRCEARRGAVVSVWCAITEFIASGCLGNVSGFKKYLNKCAEDGHWFS